MLHATTTRRASSVDSRILRAIARRGKGHVSLAEDRAWLRALTPNPRQQLARMERRGSLARVARGRYVALPSGADTLSQAGAPRLLLTAALPDRDDYYLGYLSALVDHGLTDEGSHAIYLAVRGTRLPQLEKLGDRPVTMTRVTSDRKWFGTERVRALGRAFYYRSDLERTLIDTLDRPALCGETDTWVCSWERAFAQSRVDVTKLIDYADSVGGVLAVRCGFWLRELGLVREARLVLRAAGAPLGGRNLLDSSAPFGDGAWQRDRDTGLTVNIPERSLNGWLEYGK